MRRILCILCLLSVVGIAAQNNKQTNKQTNKQAEKQTEKKVGIKDFFLMLPDSAFEDYDYMELKDRKKLLKTIGQDNEDSRPYIDVCDPKNGYLSVFYYYIDDTQIQICYWNLKDGRKLVGVNRHQGFGELSFFIYENGELKDGSSYMPDTKNVQVTDFFDTSRLNAKEKKILQDIFNDRIVFRYVLPRKGRSIEMCIGFPIQDMDYETMFDEAGIEDKIAYKHIVFKWVNEKWVKEVQKGEGTQIDDLSKNNN